MDILWFALGNGTAIFKHFIRTGNFDGMNFTTQ